MMPREWCCWGWRRRCCGKRLYWHRATDTLDNLDRAGLERAAVYSWALLQTIDEQPAAA
jgi:hypothetical protein